MRVRRIFIFSLAALAASFARADAKVTSVTVVKREAFAPGTSFGSAGEYVRISGTVHGELNPADPRNAKIDGIALAPRNARGMVEY
ncbi:MAG: hypothetical protein ABR591_09385, partial [Candidatus Velthaea sp.]